MLARALKLFEQACTVRLRKQFLSPAVAVVAAAVDDAALEHPVSRSTGKGTLVGSSCDAAARRGFDYHYDYESHLAKSIPW